MDCELLQEDLSAFADGELDEAARTSVADHVSGCRLCAAELDDLRALKWMVSQVRRNEVDPPESLTIFPNEQPAEQPQASVAFWRRPLPGRAVVLAAAAVFVGLLFGWQHTVNHYGSLARANDTVVAHLSGLTSALEDGSAQRVRAGEGPHVLYNGPADVGGQSVNQAVLAIEGTMVSLFTFDAGEFDDSQMARMTAGPSEYRVAESREFSIVTFADESEQVVLVAACPAEVLVGLAQRIPHTIAPSGHTGY